MRTFAVTDVQRAAHALPELEPRVAIEALAGATVEAWSRSDRRLARAWSKRLAERGQRLVTEEAAWHPFVAAVHAAFDEHRPLVLSPDAVWLMIAQGFAFHVALHAEALRDRLVDHSGRELIAVRFDDFVKGSPDNAWPDAFAALSNEVAARTGPLASLVVADFSTTDAASRTASQIALLAAAQPYFAYQVHTLCGIPEITLTGTADDWRAIRTRVEGLRSFGTDFWIDELAPVLDAIIRAEAGEVDRDFWCSFYKLKGGSGGPYVSGWINVLLPYLNSTSGMKMNDATLRWKARFGSDFGGGPTTDLLPSGLSRVPFLWKYLQTEFKMEILGGFVGVAQDPDTLALSPEIGWAVRDASSV